MSVGRVVTVHSVESFGNEETGFDITQVHGQKATVDIDGMTDDQILEELSERALLFGVPSLYVLVPGEFGMEVQNSLTGEIEILIRDSVFEESHH